MTCNEITYEIRGAIYDVYIALGPGLLESVYEEALVFELEQRGLKVERQKQVPINYKGNVRGGYKAGIYLFRDFRDFRVTLELLVFLCAIDQPFMQLCTKNVVMTKVMSDPTNFRAFPIFVLFNFIYFSQN